MTGTGDSGTGGAWLDDPTAMVTALRVFEELAELRRRKG